MTAELRARLVEGAVKYVERSRSSVHLDGCIGSLWSVTCECGWADMAFAVGALRRASEDAELSAILEELNVGDSPDQLRELLSAHGWRKEIP